MLAYASINMKSLIALKIMPAQFANPQWIGTLNHEKNETNSWDKNMKDKDILASDESILI